MLTESIVRKKVDNPFPGLQAFQEADAPFFFGREEEVGVAWDILSRTHFLTVLGPSGSGKTSLIQAGILANMKAKLWEGRGGPNWHIARCIPHDNPLESLTNALRLPGVLAPQVKPDTGIRSDIETHLKRNSRGLIEAFLDSDLVDLDSKGEIIRFRGNLLVFVDQFENIFKNNEDDAPPLDAISFVNLLVTASKALELPIYVVLGFQSDFIGNITEFSGLTEAIMEGRLVMPAMFDAQLEDVIEKPILTQGIRLERELTLQITDNLKKDVPATDAQLSVVQYILRRLWTKKDDPKSGLEIIEEESHKFPRLTYIGTGLLDLTSAQAISEDIERVFLRFDTELDPHRDSDFKDKNQWICEVLFKAITEKRGANLYLPRTQQVTVLEVANIAGIRAEEVIHVVKAFMAGENKFLTSSDDLDIEPEGSYIEIIHPIIIDKWPRLKKWMDEEARDGESYRDLLSESKKPWHDTDGTVNKNKLLRDPNLSISWQLMFPDMAHTPCRQIPDSFYEEDNAGDFVDPALKRPNKFWAERYKGEELKTGKQGGSSEPVFVLADDPFAFHTHAVVFLKESKKKDCLDRLDASDRAKNRRIRDRIAIFILGLLALAALIALIGASYLALKASISTYEAKNSENKAILAQIDAEISKARAEKEKIIADSARAIAQDREYRLDTAQQRLKLEIQRANQNFELAEKNAADAQANLFLAEVKAEEAALNARIARKNELAAKASQEEIRSLSKRIQAQALAANSQRLVDDTSLLALLAVEAHSLNQREDCDHPNVQFNELDPNIYLALNNALETLEKDDYNTILLKRVVKEDPELENEYLHRGLIRGMTFNPKAENDSLFSQDLLFSSSGDGKIYRVQPDELQYYDKSFDEKDISWLRQLRGQNTNFTPIFLSPYNKNSILPPKLFKMMALSTNQRWMALGGDMASIYLYSTINRTAPPVKVEVHQGQGVWDIIPFSYGERHMGFFSTGADGRINYVDWKSAQPVASELFQVDRNDPIISLAYDQGSGLLAGGSAKGEVYIWELIDNTRSEEDSLILRLTRRLTQPDAKGITAMKFGPDKNTLATGHKDGLVQIWNLNKRTYERKKDHGSDITDLQFSGDYRYLATSSYDRTVLVYTRSVGNDIDKEFSEAQTSPLDFFSIEPLRLRGKSQNDLLPWATSLAFNSSSSDLFVGYRNGILKKWSLEPASMADRIMNALVEQNRSTCITPDKWIRYMGRNTFYCGANKQPVTKCR